MLINVCLLAMVVQNFILLVLLLVLSVALTDNQVLGIDLYMFFCLKALQSLF